MPDKTELEAILTAIPKEQLFELAVKGMLAGQQPQYQIERIEINELFQKHLTYAESREFTHSSLRLYRRAHEHFKKYTNLRGLKHVDEVRFDHAEEFYNFLRKYPRCNKKGKLSVYTTLSMYKVIKAMFAYALKRDNIVKNPFVNKVYPVSQITEWWTDDYVYNKLIPAIRRFCQKRVLFKTELKVRLTYNTGLRAGIIHRIRRKDVTINEDDRVYVNTKCKVQKSSEMQRVTTEILEVTTKEMLVKYIDELDQSGIGSDEYIFAKSTPKSGYISYKNTLIFVCKMACIPYLSPHKAKHGFITKMAKAGLSSRQICALTGNRTPSLIEKVYSHVEFEDVRETASNIINNID